MPDGGPLGCPCRGSYMTLAWRYDRPPDGETHFPALDGKLYRRDVMRCTACEHYTSAPPLDPATLYRDAYVDATYGEHGLRGTFDRIMGLPPDRSDNRGRVSRVSAFAERNLPNGLRRALDVGSGLAVFPAALAQEGWRCSALDPDPRAAEHAAGIAGVEAICGDLSDVETKSVYDLVTLNKVLEHVEDPVAMLAHSARFLAPGGLVYVEVPDGPAAAAEGPGREEFFVEHLHVFSPASLGMLSARAGLTMIELTRLREPSGKYTLAGFMTTTDR